MYVYRETERERETLPPKNDGNTMFYLPRLCISPDSAKASGAIACRVYEPTQNSKENKV